jgi:hypothetical protein
VDASRTQDDLDVSRDGQRFLMIREAAGGSSAARNLILVQSFSKELKRLVPVH